MADNIRNSIEEKIYRAKSGWAVLILSVAAYIAAFIGVVFGGMLMDEGYAVGIPIFVVALIYVCLGWIFWLGLKVIRPNEAVVLTLFGKYIGTLREE